jgi:hypothetical protein
MTAVVSTIPTSAALFERFREAIAVWQHEQTDDARVAALRAYWRWEGVFIRESDRHAGKGAA